MSKTSRILIGSGVAAPFALYITNAISNGLPTVVGVPVPVPGPAGATGATGPTGPAGASGHGSSTASSGSPDSGADSAPDAGVVVPPYGGSSDASVNADGGSKDGGAVVVPDAGVIVPPYGGSSDASVNADGGSIVVPRARDLFPGDYEEDDDNSPEKSFDIPTSSSRLRRGIAAAVSVAPQYDVVENLLTAEPTRQEGWALSTDVGVGADLGLYHLGVYYGLKYGEQTLERAKATNGRTILRQHRAGGVFGLRLAPGSRLETFVNASLGFLGRYAESRLRGSSTTSTEMDYNGAEVSLSVESAEMLSRLPRDLFGSRKFKLGFKAGLDFAVGEETIGNTDYGKVQDYRGLALLTGEYERLLFGAGVDVASLHSLRWAENVPVERLRILQAQANAGREISVRGYRDPNPLAVSPTAELGVRFNDNWKGEGYLSYGVAGGLDSFEAGVSVTNDNLVLGVGYKENNAVGDFKEQTLMGHLQLRTDFSKLLQRGFDRFRDHRVQHR